MTFSLQSLSFDSEYEFDVTVSYDDERFAGKLSLKKESTHLAVFGERGEGQPKFLPWDHIARLECPDINATITLFDLRFMSGSSRTIGHNPPKGFCESKYEVGAVLFSKAQFGQHRSFSGINIHSDTISDWLGNTKKQEEIIDLYWSRKLLKERDRDLLEFSCEAPGIGMLGIGYNPKIFHSSPEFKAGVSFHPSLFILFSQAASAEEALQVTTEIIAFFKFITGGNVELSQIEFMTGGEMFSSNATLYFSRSDARRRKDEYIFFPLGKDLRFDTLGLPKLPVNVVARYLLQEIRQKVRFKQYLKYREMSSIEEKFLGYFRLLEALSYKEGRYLDEHLLLEVIQRASSYLVRKFGDRKNVQSFLKRLPRWNASKYNAEKCIIDMLNEVPNTASEKWRFGRKDVASICKLRNDITHANEYEASTTTVSGYTKFVEVLVVYSLLLQIGIDTGSAASILHRLSGYHEIVRVDA